jgi:hypothetical protein
MEPVRIFIGTSANGEDAEMEMIYEDSLRRHATGPLEITWMRQNHDAESIWGNWNTRRWPTPFSGFRWAIPQACRFEGRAIYTDEDMINFRDIRDLWNIDLGDCAIGARKGLRFNGHEFCVMVMDCAKMKDLLMPAERMKLLPESHFRFIQKFSGSDYVKDIDFRWNVLDGENLQPYTGQTPLPALTDMFQLHWTNMATQPWQPKWYVGPIAQHPRKDLVDLWYQLRDDCLARGLTPQRPNIDYPAFGEYTIIGQ